MTEGHMIVPRQFAGEVDLIMRCEDHGELLTGLKEALEVTLRAVILTAAYVRRLDDLGIEIPSRFEKAGLSYYRLISHGQILAELFVTLCTERNLLSKASQLPLPQQRRIAANEPLKVMELGGDHRMVPPLAMTGCEITQMFTRGRLRSEGEQIGYLKDRMQLERTAPGDELVSLDKKRGGIVVRGVFVSATDMAHYLAELTPRKK